MLKFELLKVYIMHMKCSLSLPLQISKYAIAYFYIQLAFLTSTVVFTPLVLANDQPSRDADDCCRSEA